MNSRNIRNANTKGWMFINQGTPDPQIPDKFIPIYATFVDIEDKDKALEIFKRHYEYAIILMSFQINTIEEVK